MVELVAAAAVGPWWWEWVLSYFDERESEEKKS
uniref:Uncharacterized protein n=1 Tax=Rhizophora mucronata TaxID=61149 RepID=A0A2P2NGU1_RHIMU